MKDWRSQGNQSQIFLLLPGIVPFAICKNGCYQATVPTTHGHSSDSCYHQYKPGIHYVRWWLVASQSPLGLTTEVLGKENPFLWGDTIWGLTDASCCADSKVKISLHGLCSPFCGPSTSCRSWEVKNFFRWVFGTRKVSRGGGGGWRLIFKTLQPLIQIMFPSPSLVLCDLLIIRTASKAIHNSSFPFFFFNESHKIIRMVYL